MPRRVKVCQGSAHADAVAGVEGYRPYAGRVRVVHVRVVGKPGVETRLMEGALNGPPLIAGEPPHRDWAVRAVEIVSYVGVGLKTAKVGHELEVGPLAVALGSPTVVVLRQAA